MEFQCKNAAGRWETIAEGLATAITHADGEVLITLKGHAGDYRLVLTALEPAMLARSMMPPAEQVIDVDRLTDDLVGVGLNVIRFG